MDFGRVGTVIVDQDAEPQFQTDRGLEIRNRHQKSAVAGAEHRELAGIGNRKADRRSKPEADRLKGMAEAGGPRVRHPQILRHPTAEMPGIRGDDAIGRQHGIDRLAERPGVDEVFCRGVAISGVMIAAVKNAFGGRGGATARPRSNAAPIEFGRQRLGDGFGVAEDADADRRVRTKSSRRRHRPGPRRRPAQSACRAWSSSR